jgi:hypothetical protein
MKHCILSKRIRVSVDYGKMETMTTAFGLDPADLAYLHKKDGEKMRDGQIEWVSFHFLEFQAKPMRCLLEQEATEKLETLRRNYGLVPVSFGKLILFDPGFWFKFWNRQLLEKPFGTLDNPKETSEAKLYPVRFNQKIKFMDFRFFCQRKGLLLLAEAGLEKISFRKRIAYTTDGSRREEYPTEKSPSHVFM